MSEQAIPRDYETLTPYFNAIRRIHRATVAGTSQIVMMSFVIGPTGEVLHSEPEVKRLEPRGKTIEIKDI